jgi:hypothetical protein
MTCIVHFFGTVLGVCEVGKWVGLYKSSIDMGSWAILWCLFCAENA